MNSSRSREEPGTRAGSMRSNFFSISRIFRIRSAWGVVTRRSAKKGAAKAARTAAPKTGAAKTRKAPAPKTPAEPEQIDLFAET